jgi:hypothetical protein
MRVKERIFNYLKDAGRGVSASQILNDVLNIRSPDPRSSDTVLAGILGRDPRFASRDGLWHLRSLPGKPAEFHFGETVVMHLQSANRLETLQGVCGAIRWADGRLEEVSAPAPAGLLRKLRDALESCLLILWSRRELRLWNGWLQSRGLEPRHAETLFLRELAARVLGRALSKVQFEDLASEFGLSPPDEERPREVTQHLKACWVLLLDRVPASSGRDLDSLRKWMESPDTAVDFSRFAFGPGFLRQLPDAAGVYLMKDCEGTVLYVGKSRNLKRRLYSYFTPRALHNSKTARIHERLYSIDVLTTGNEVEALLTEMRMIRKFRPAVNLQTEIHGRKEKSHQGDNLLLFVVGEGQKRVKIYFLRNGMFAGRHSASLGHAPSKRLRERLQSVFFALERTGKQKGEGWEKELVFRWLAANRKRLNCLDVDAAGSSTSALELLRRYLCDPDGLACKVYYR